MVNYGGKFSTLIRDISAFHLFCPIWNPSIGKEFLHESETSVSGNLTKAIETVWESDCRVAVDPRRGGRRHQISDPGLKL